MPKAINIYYLSLLADTPKRGYWDYGILEDIFIDSHTISFNSIETARLPEDDIAVVVIPGRSHAGHEVQINKELQKINGVVLFVMGDEENVFRVEDIKHDNIKIWVQNPDMQRHKDYRVIGCGYPPAIREVSNELVNKNLDVFFSGQVTHSRRHEMYEAAKRIVGSGIINGTESFTSGYEQPEYYKKMSQAKLALCPSGPQTVDTFRLYEALELGCVPIADTKTPHKDMAGFWEWLFSSSIHFPQVVNWESVIGVVLDCVGNYPRINNRVQSAWMQYKQNLNHWLVDDLVSVGCNVEYPHGLVTAVIPISIAPDHPDTSIIDETIESVYKTYPDCQTFLTFDGLREQQSNRSGDYAEFIRRVLWKHRGKRIVPYVFNEHKHQVGMLRSVIDDIKTPLILYVESDAPIVTDEPIEWDKISEFVLSGKSNHVRLHHEAFIPKEHEHLMLGMEDGFMKTIQWSQRPHLASTAFYKRVLSENFSPEANCFIEDLVHGKVQEDYFKYKDNGWQQWRLHIYHPEGNIKRSYHLDQRKGSEKYDALQKW